MSKAFFKSLRTWRQLFDRLPRDWTASGVVDVGNGALYDKIDGIPADFVRGATNAYSALVTDVTQANGGILHRRKVSVTFGDVEASLRSDGEKIFIDNATVSSTEEAVSLGMLAGEIERANGAEQE